MAQINKSLQKAMKGIRKYRYAMIVLLLGMALLLIPDTEAEPQREAQPKDDTDSYAQQMEQRLTLALSQIEGVGRVEVVLTLANKGQIHYQSDIQSSREENDEGVSVREERKTVILSEGSAYDEAAVSTVEYPAFLGALIVCEGGENASIRWELTQAVSALTGLSSEKITVVKMK